MLVHGQSFHRRPSLICNITLNKDVEHYFGAGYHMRPCCRPAANLSTRSTLDCPLMNECLAASREQEVA